MMVAGPIHSVPGSGMHLPAGASYIPRCLAEEYIFFFLSSKKRDVETAKNTRQFRVSAVLLVLLPFFFL